MGKNGEYMIFAIFKVLLACEGDSFKFLGLSTLLVDIDHFHISDFKFQSHV